MLDQARPDTYLEKSLLEAEKAGFRVLSTAEHVKRADLLKRVRSAHEMHWHDYAVEAAAANLRDVIEEARRLGLVSPLVEGLVNLAHLRHHAGDWTAAEQLGLEAIELAEQIRDADTLARAHLQVALTLFHLERDPVAHLDEAEALVDRLAPATVASLKYTQAKIAHARSDIEVARVLLTGAVDLADAADELYMQCRARARLGSLERLCGNLDRAERHLTVGLELAKASGYQRLHASCLLDLGMVSLKRDDTERAVAYLRDALRRFSELGHVLGMAYASSALGTVARLRGALDEAEVLQLCPLAVYVQTGHACGKALAHRRLGSVMRDAGRYEEGQRHLEAARDIYRNLESLDGEAVSLAALAKLVRARSGAKEALPLALEAVDKLGEMAGRFCQGGAQEQFSRLHSWCFSLAFLCAAESGDAQAALHVASVVQADRAGKRARLRLLNSEDPAIRKIVRKIVSCELGLHGSADEPVGHHAVYAAALRETLVDLYEELRAADADTAALFQGLSERQVPPAPVIGHHRLMFYGYEEVVPPRLQQGVTVVWESAQRPNHVSKTALSPDEWARFSALCHNSDDATAAEIVRYGNLLLPDDLKTALVAGEVRRLDLFGDCSTFPVGRCIVDGRRVDAMTNVNVFEIDAAVPA